MKRSSFNVLFFLKKTKLLKNGEASVCMRITVDGTRVENNIRKSIDPSLWSQAKESARGKSRKSCDLNAYIENARIKLHQIFCELEEQNQPITARLLQEIFFGQDKEPEAVRTLIGTMQEHNDQCRALVGKDYALITVRRYESCKRYLAELIRQKYGKDDLPLAEVNGELVRAFEFYLKTEKECQQNTVIRYMKCLKKITNLALANEWIAKGPFIGIKFHEKEVIREFLTMDELLSIYHKEFSLERITVVRDVFIFAAFTGLAFIDVQQLSPEHIVKDNNENLWIRKPRQKTKNMCNIPLLVTETSQYFVFFCRYVCSAILAKCLIINVLRLILVILFFIAFLNITYTARHSYATSVCLANGVSIENVAKMLGHSNIKMTQHYARVLDSSILKDMNNVRDVLSNCM